MSKQHITKTRKKRNYIGLSSTLHDPALAVVDSKGEIVFAEATERFLQNKRAWNCVPDSMLYVPKIIEEYCENDAELVVAQSWSKKTAARFRFLRLLMPPIMNLSEMGSLNRANTMMMLNGMIGIQESCGSHVESAFYNKSTIKRVIKKYYDHHTTHAAAACYASPFKNAVCVVVDGYGENLLSTAFFVYENGEMKRLQEIKGSKWTSLGLYYQTICSMCGFDPMKGEEWKVMGLAPYGKYNETLYGLLQSYIKVKNGRLIHGVNKHKSHSCLCNEIKKLSFNVSDIAYNGQMYFSELMTSLLHYVYTFGFSENLVLTGGCALNSSYNGTILETTPFKQLFIPSAPADDGNAIGAALLAYYEDLSPQNSVRNYQSPYLGARMYDKTLMKLERLGRLRSSPLNGKNIFEKAAELLAEGKILGWIQDRAEFGPRALGNRSILADPRSSTIKDRLNDTVKFREGFRPFAPSILHEYGKEYFENYQESPYMERTLRFKKEVLNRVPGVIHIDGTGRLQTVKREWNQRFYDLICAFKDITGIPLLLNTSFNVQGKPIIHSIEDAIAVFYTSGLDALVIGEKLFEKKNSI